ncbi:MAG TPA: putative glycoside hydrolase [Longimicrobiales bacterium]|nr:putative glycoside hydrolase [Longimicrobiales bacterium]
MSSITERLRAALGSTHALLRRHPLRLAVAAVALTSAVGIAAFGRGEPGAGDEAVYASLDVATLPARPASFTAPLVSEPPSYTPDAAAPIPRPVPPGITADDFRVDLTPVPFEARVRRPAALRGIYVSAWAAGSRAKRARLMALADRTEINAFVVDIKDATGFVTYETRVPLARQIGAHRDVRVGDMRALLAELRARHIYPIARIVVFKDPLLATRRPDLAIQDSAGGVWVDHHGDRWVDSYNRNVWEYVIALGREAVAMGFSEVQWDYVRFPDVPSRHMETAVFPAREGRARDDAIREFLLHSRERLADLQAPLTADVFGLTTSVAGDMGIGQRWSKMVDATDALLPMVYPSHYYRGSYGLAHPNAQPYEVVRKAMEDALARTRGVRGGAAIVPWLQDFTMGKPAYGPAHVRAQMEAVYDAGLSEWILWNPASNYTEEALAPAGGRAPRFPRPAWAPEARERDAGGLLGKPAHRP